MNFQSTYSQRKDALRAIRRKGLNPDDYRIAEVIAVVPKKGYSANRFMIAKKEPILPEIKLSLKQILDPHIQQAFQQRKSALKSVNAGGEIERLEEREWDFSDAWDEAKSSYEVVALLRSWFSITA